MASSFRIDPACSRTAGRRRGRTSARWLRVEALEPRTLLASSLQFTDVDGDRFLVRVLGGGSVSVQDANHNGRAEVSLTQTGPSSELQVTTQSVGNAGDATLHVESIAVATHFLRAIRGGATLDLQGPITPLSGDVSALELRLISPGAAIDVERDLTRLDVRGDATFDLMGHLIVGRDLSQVTIAGALNLNGGSWQLGRDLRTMQVGGDMTLFVIPPAAPPPPPGDASVPALAPAAVPAAPTAGTLLVGRDLGSLQVRGDLTLGLGSLNVQRDLGSLSVSGDLDSSDAGMILVGRRLASLLVTGDWLGTSNDMPEPGPAAAALTLAAGPSSLDLVVGGSPQVGTVGLLKVRGGTTGVQVFAGSQITSLVLEGGLESSQLVAGAIGAMVVGPGPRGAIVDSEIDVASRIEAAQVTGDIVGSQILVNPLTTFDLPGGPGLASVRFTARFLTFTVIVIIPVSDHVEARAVSQIRGILVMQATMPASLGGQIGSAAAPFLLKGNLVDSLLAVNWSAGQDGIFDAPSAPRPLARTIPSGDDGIGRGTLHFRLAPGFRAVDSGAGVRTGLYARTVVLNPSAARVETV